MGMMKMRMFRLGGHGERRICVVDLSILAVTLVRSLGF